MRAWGSWNIILRLWDSCWQSRFTVFSPFGFNSSFQADRYSIPSPPPQLHLLWYSAGLKTRAVKKDPLKCNTFEEWALTFKIWGCALCWFQESNVRQTANCEGGRRGRVTALWPDLTGHRRLAGENDSFCVDGWQAGWRGSGPVIGAFLLPSNPTGCPNA